MSVLTIAILIISLPYLSEAIYIPLLPEIARAIGISVDFIQHTVSIYLLGFIIGTFFWGKLSDKYGRKPCALIGLLIFMLGSVGCYFSTSINMLLLSRLLQGFGANAGSVIGQSIFRDAFDISALMKAYSIVGSILALSIGIVVIIVRLIAQKFLWLNIFILLILFTAVLLILVAFKLPETHASAYRTKQSTLNIARQLAKDKYVAGFASIVAACHAINFSFARGLFSLMNDLNLSFNSFLIICELILVAYILGGIFCRRLHKTYSPKKIMKYGLITSVFSTGIFSLILLINQFVYRLSGEVIIILMVISQMITSSSISMILSNGLALALVNHKQAIGTASGLFGFFYVTMMSVFILFGGLLNNGTLLPISLYLFAISCFMLAVNYTGLDQNQSITS